MRALAWSGGVLVAASLLLGCSDKKATQITVAMSTEALVPTELDELQIDVLRGGAPRFSQEYTLPDDARLPGTLTLVAEEDEETSSRLLVIRAKKSGTTHEVVRKVRFGFAKERSKLLRIRLQEVCIDVPCEGDFSCVDGVCVSPDIDVNTLPDFSGGTAEAFRPAGCFDETACAAGLQVIAVDAAGGCRFPAPAGELFNVLLAWSGSPGVFHTIDTGSYSVASGEITLSSPMCRALEDGRAVSVAVSTSCPAKDPSVPICVEVGPGPGAGGSGGAAGSAGAGGDAGGAAGATGGASGAGGLSGTAGVSGTGGAGGTGGTAAGGTGGAGAGAGGMSGQGGAAGQNGTPLTGVKSVGVGLATSCVTLSDGGVRCAGENNHLGTDPAPFLIPYPTPVNGVTGAATVAVGWTHRCVLTAAKDLVCWGYNGAAEVSADGLTSGTADPTTIPGGPYDDVDVGEGFTCALASGTVSCWGTNELGAMGTGTITPTYEARSTVSGLTGVGALSSGFAKLVCALVGTPGSATVSCWGHGIASPSPVAVTTAQAVAVGGGDRVFVLLADGSVWVAAVDAQGTGFTAPSQAINVPPLSQLSVGTSLVGLRKSDGAIVAGQARDIAADSITVTEFVDPAPGSVREVKAGYGQQYDSGTNCAVTVDDRVLCWGDDGQGQMGIGKPADVLAPSAVQGAADLVNLYLGESSSSGITSSGAVLYWGWSGAWESLSAANAPATAVPTVLTSGIVSGSSGPDDHKAYVLTSSGAVLMYEGGSPLTFRLGGTSTQYSAVQWGGDFDLAIRGVAPAREMVVYVDGDLTGTGLIADTTVTPPAVVPVPLPAEPVSFCSDSRVYSGANHVCATLTDGTLHCWGRNDQGQTGQPPSDTPDPSPKQVQGLVGVVSACAGRSHTCAVDGTGAVSCWGGNGDWELGNAGGSTNVPTPVTVPMAVEVACGPFHTCARTAASEVWCWGYNANGQLGNGTLSSTPIPTKVALSGAQRLAAGTGHTCAIVEGGGASCWGTSYFGQVGNGRKGFYPLPRPMLLPP
jgi:alpha-tubulin suppressor-like RCC1 family protein